MNSKPIIYVPEATSKPPLGADGKPKLRFEVRMRAGKNGAVEKAVYIGGELLDWAVDMSSLAEAMRLGPRVFHQLRLDIQRHYVESVSEFVGRRVTAAEIAEAVETGWI